ncbi:MAG: hypothetical protein QNJ78_02240 [Gammaproteobacteria bacterium]|nr:hypothetical protein [Gammaproteobacteria bacterium]
MDAENPEFIKHRDIYFNELHPDPNQAQTAALLLADIKGIHQVTPTDPLHLSVSYHLMDISLEQIEDGLVEIGLHLDNSLLYRMKRALHYYTEETQRANHGCLHGSFNCTRKIFADRYQRLDHTCRDDRPEHWRKYL